MDVPLQQELKKRFDALPEVIQKAIKSADVQARLRKLADAQKLHLDQWQVLENEVVLALLGFSPFEDLIENIEKEVGVSREVAESLANEVSTSIFEPIREELERQLEHPEAQAKEVSGVELFAQEALANREVPIPSTPPISPATPPPPLPENKTVREAPVSGGPASGAYRGGEASSARKDIHDDPYREPPA